MRTTFMIDLAPPWRQRCNSSLIISRQRAEIFQNGQRITSGDERVTRVYKKITYGDLVGRKVQIAGHGAGTVAKRIDVFATAVQLAAQARAKAVRS